MPSSRYLDVEIALLLARHGKNAVLEALSRKIGLTPDELEAALQTPLMTKSVSGSRKKPPRADPITQLAQEHPTKAPLLRALHDRFENRTFLPELRDVRRFFERHAHPLGASNSRLDSLPRVLKLLAELDLAELEELCRAPRENTESSLGLISDQILRRNG